MAALPEECGRCGRLPTAGEKFHVCARCRQVVYCSKTCQKNSWKGGHKSTCVRLEDQQPVKSQKVTTTPAETKKPTKPSQVSAGGAAAEEPTGRVTPMVDPNTGEEASFGKDDDCSICLDKLVKPVKLPCGHWYCKECIEKLRQSASAQNSCPVCREPLPPGAAQLYDKATHIYMRVTRKFMKNSEWDEEWPQLPKKFQKEMDAARHLLEAAAQQQHPEALNSLGVTYDSGQGVAKDPAKAKEYYEAAWAQGHVHAASNLGHAIMTNRMPGEPDYAKAKDLFEQGAAKEDSRSIFNLAGMYTMGTGIPQDIKKAKKLFERGMALGDENAGFALAKLAEYGLEDNMSPGESMYQWGNGEYKDVLSRVLQRQQGWSNLPPKLQRKMDTCVAHLKVRHIDCVPVLSSKFGL